MRAKRVAEIRRQERQKKLTILGVILGVVVLVGGIVLVSKYLINKNAEELANTETNVTQVDADTIASDSEQTETEVLYDENGNPITDVQYDENGNPVSTEGSGNVTPVIPNLSASEYQFVENDNTIYMGSEEVTAEYAVLCDMDEHTIVAQKNAKTRMNPASMTKVLTTLVACEHITNLDDTFTITIDITDYAYVNDCSSVGFSRDEVVTVKDLLYGTVLKSGGDAALALAIYVAGSHEAFVDMMNQKLVDLGISDSAHFTNCVGLYDENHYCSAYDMSVIMAAAAKNPLAAEVLKTRVYTTSITEQHPEGITISNLFMRRIEDKDTLGTVMGAKTGYVVQSGNCAVSYYQRASDGKYFVCTTGNSHSSWRAIYDHVAVYNIYAAGNTSYHKDGEAPSGNEQ